MNDLEAEIERLRAVAEAAKEVATHDCQICRENWDDQREAGIMRLAQALDRARGAASA